MRLKGETMNVRELFIPSGKNRNRREFLKNSVAAVVGAGCFGNVFNAKAQPASHSHHQDQPNEHNMLIVGKQTVFLSHLPMFSAPGFVSPHRYQVILEATFMKSDSNPQTVYAGDRRNNPKTKIYMLNPDKFILPDLVSSGANPSLSRLKGKVFRGHFEREGRKLLASDVDVIVKNVVHFREFASNATPLAKLEYILFGKGNELFLAHFITKPPDFDQVLSVNVADRSFTDEELGKGLRVIFSRPNSIAQRLREGQEAEGEIQGMGGATRPPRMKFKTGVEFYFEEGELRVPATFDPTAAEIEAGFR
jgi:hypothetical protein